MARENADFKSLSAVERLIKALLAGLCIQQKVVRNSICTDLPTLFKQLPSAVRAAKHQWRLGCLIHLLFAALAFLGSF